MKTRTDRSTDEHGVSCGSDAAVGVGLSDTSTFSALAFAAANGRRKVLPLDRRLAGDDSKQHSPGLG
jgi:hypothetical protein